MRRNLVVVAILALVGTLPMDAQVGTPGTKRSSPESAIIAAVVRRETLGLRGTVFLDVNGKDPSPELLRQFSVWYVRVLPRSRAVFVPSDDPRKIGGFKDRISGEPGPYFTTGDLKWLDDARVEISGGWYQPCGTFTVVKQKGVWVVSEYRAWEVCF